MTKYKVRSFPLHKVITDSRGNRSTQVFQPFAEVELDEAEAVRYQHLIEPIKVNTIKG